VNAPRINVHLFPIATTGWFFIIVFTILFVGYGNGESIALPLGLASFQYLNGLFFDLAIVLVAFILYLAHPLLQRSAFGASQCLDDASLSRKLDELSGAMDVRKPEIRMDSNIRNYDALVFGLRHKTMLLGRGFRLLNAGNQAQTDVRLSHELAHIKNRDVLYTFYSDAIVKVFIAFLAAGFLYFSALVIWEVILGWFNWRNAGHSTAQFYAAWQGWLQNRFGFLVASLVNIVVWTAGLILQHRALLRSRELYADNIAARYVSAEALAQSLAAPVDQDRRGASLRGVFSNHPAPVWRHQAAFNPLLLLQPTLFAALNYGFLVAFLFEAANPLKPLLNKIAGIDPAQNLTLRDVIAAPGTMVATAVLMLAVLPAIVALIGFVFRSAGWLYLSPQNRLEKFRILLGRVIALTVGAYIGATLNPLAVVSFWYAPHRLLQSVNLIEATLFGAIYAGGVGVFGLVILRLISSPRKKPPSRLIWTVLGLFFFVIVNIAFTTGFMSLEMFRSELDYRLPVALALEMTVFWLLAYWIARGTWSFRFQSLKYRPPWLYERMPQPTADKRWD
jgi:Zn-dependent protease with chaperone function